MRIKELNLVNNAWICNSGYFLRVTKVSQLITQKCHTLIFWVIRQKFLNGWKKLQRGPVSHLLNSPCNILKIHNFCCYSCFQAFNDLPDLVYKAVTDLELMNFCPKSSISPAALVAYNTEIGFPGTGLHANKPSLGIWNFGQKLLKLFLTILGRSWRILVRINDNEIVGRP